MRWERIDNYSERLRVPGGWLVRYHQEAIGFIDQGRGISVALIFVNDKYNQWTLGEEE